MRHLKHICPVRPLNRVKFDILLPICRHRQSRIQGTEVCVHLNIRFYRVQYRSSKVLCRLICMRQDVPYRNMQVFLRHAREMSTLRLFRTLRRRQRRPLNSRQGRMNM